MSFENLRPSGNSTEVAPDNESVDTSQESVVAEVPESRARQNLEGKNASELSAIAQESLDMRTKYGEKLRVAENSLNLALADYRAARQQIGGIQGMPLGDGYVNEMNKRQAEAANRVKSIVRNAREDNEMYKFACDRHNAASEQMGSTEKRNPARYSAAFQNALTEIGEKPME
jgi:hypothetical protein